MLSIASERLHCRRPRRRGKLRRLPGVLEGPAAVALAPVLLLTGHIGYVTAAVFILTGMGATAREVGKLTARRAQLRAVAPLLHVTSRCLELTSELAHPDLFLSTRLSRLIFDPLVNGATSLISRPAALIFGQRKDSRPAVPSEWQATLGMKPRGHCPFCGQELVTNMPHCPACDSLLAAHSNRDTASQRYKDRGVLSASRRAPGACHPEPPGDEALRDAISHAGRGGGSSRLVRL